MEQADILVELLYEEPFASDLIYSLVALLQSVFELSKNSYPVPRDRIKDWYANKVENVRVGATERERMSSGG